MAAGILDTKTCGPSSVESFKLVELLSDDSNFKNEIISSTALLILKLLSFPPYTVTCLFEDPSSSSSASALTTSTPPKSMAEQQQKEVMILVFRIVGNLHCFNEHVSKPEDKDRFLHTTVAELEGYGGDHEISSSYVLENLNYLLYRLSKENHIYLLNTEELELVTSFTRALEQELPPFRKRGRKSND